MKNPPEEIDTCAGDAGLRREEVVRHEPYPRLYFVWHCLRDTLEGTREVLNDEV